MRRWISPLVAAALAVSSPTAAQTASGGSTVPCAVPMLWSIGEIDRRFELSPDDARRALTEAASLWERATGRELFEISATGGSSITFEYDDRQRAVEEWRMRRAALDEERAELARRRAEIELASRGHDAESVAYERAAAEYQRAVQAFNADVQRWNREGGAPPEQQSELDRRRQGLARTQGELSERQRQLESAAGNLQAEVRDLNAWIARLNQRDAQVARNAATRATESGLYDEMVRRRDGRVDSVTRRIRVFRYASHEEMVVVLAHELGHALGLGHAPEPGSVMSAVIANASTVTRAGLVTTGDVQMLAARCSTLAPSAER